MEKDKISIIMSVYNETEEELKKSIGSVLSQTYSNFEYIIVCDNPLNKNICSFLNGINDNRVRIIMNKRNMGLVWSLNYALKFVSGEYIARMDADDICINTRLYDELQYLISHKCDIVGSYVDFIDENDLIISKEIKNPTEHMQIKKFLKQDPALVHPTWLAKKKVFTNLDGYRNIPYCEDYDFLIRAVRNGFILGNVDKVLLKYRIRAKGISKSNEVKQYVIHEYLAKKYNSKDYLSPEEIEMYLSSEKFKKKLNHRQSYIEKKNLLKNGSFYKKFKASMNLITNYYFWRGMYLKLRRY